MNFVMKNFFRAILPSNTKAKLRAMLAKLDLSISALFGHKILRFKAPWFYHWFNSQFSREQVAVLAGRNAYHNSQGIGANTSALLRRNIHRIEKGLSMSPRRPVFAEDYIGETLDCFCRCLTNSEQCIEELSWAKDVLTEYFAKVGETHTILAAKLAFDGADFSELDEQGDDTTRVPYSQDRVISSGIDAETFTALCQQRRSVRWFTEQSVPDDVLNQAIATAALAPSACNRQPFEFYVANEPEKAQKIARLAGGTVGFAHNIQSIIVVVGNLSAYPLERDRHVIYIDGSLAAMQLMLALETHGLSSCPINWPDIEVPERKMAKLLDLAIYQRPIMLIAVGYPDPSGKIPFSQKKVVSVLRKDV